VITQVRSYERGVQLLMVNQFTINLGFYMLMPYLATHLSGTLGLAGWLVGFVLGVRNFSQQGMFLVGGTLADRFGYKPLIVAGCVLRTVGFATLGLRTFLTAGPKESRAWTIKRGATAPQAAGVIHTDFERGFIKAEIVSYDDLVDAGSMAEAKARGKVRIEGKDYVMADGDVVEFRFNV